MKLATRAQAGQRDGELVVVSRDGARCLGVPEIAATLQQALDDWPRCAPRLRIVHERLQRGEGEPLVLEQLLAPLPRAYEWLDGSAYISHIELVRKARGAALPERLLTDPLIYQGGSGVLLGPRAPVELPDPAWGLDFEGEVGVVLSDTPRGTTAPDAQAHVRLLVLVNDWSYRNLIPAELEKGFGFVQSKPATAFSPFAITPDELGPAWSGGRVHRPLRCRLNGTLVGEAQAGPEMHFSFFELVAHICKTRSFTAGTILGSGTVSNRSADVGVSCLAERRVRELLATGTATTPFLTVGDEITIEMLDEDGGNLFGTIRQEVVDVQRPAPQENRP